MASQVLHTHCESCVKRSCMERPCPPYSCEILQCHLNCGACFHRCKREEHSTVCPNEKVSCINSAYGCPALMPRSACGPHLRVCPASVVFCNMEWNRWPVYSPERKARVPFAERQFMAKYGQLDVAVALRDQRMLERAMKAPRSTRRVLRNNLTRRFPAVPILMKARSVDEESRDSVTSCSDDDSDAPWNQAMQPPGLVASVCNELFSVKKKMSSGCDENQSSCDDYHSNCDCAVSANTSTTPANTTANIHSNEIVDNKNCWHGDSVDDNSGLCAADASAEQGDEQSRTVPEPPSDGSLMLQEILSLDLNMEFVTCYQAKPKSMYTFLCAQLFRRDEYSWHFKNVHGDILCNLNGWLEQRCPLAQEGCTYSYRRMYPGHKGAAVVYNDIVESFGVRPAVAHTLLSQRESMEREYAQYVLQTRGKEATPEIVTSQHYQTEVKVDGNLNRQIPDRREMSKSPGRDLRPDPLTSLPVEVIQHVASFLDGHSLCNLSLTCTVLRSVCCSLLEDKGIVVQEWTKSGTKEKPHWTVSEQRWMFSSGFEPVTCWGFNDYVHVSEHLKKCPFYKRQEKTVPVAIIPRVCKSDTDSYTDHTHVETILKRMYPHVEFPLKQEFQFPQG